MNALLSATSIGLSRDQRGILADVAFELHAGEMVGVLGPNGAGKSSLLRILAAIDAPDAGAVHLRQKPVSTMRPRTRAAAIGFLPQEPELHWPMSVFDAVALGRLPFRHGLAGLRAADTVAITRALERCNLGHLARRPADTLSGGERARMHLARLFAGEHAILLVDEPIANLDPRYQLAVLDLLAGHATGQVTNPAAEHVSDLATDLATDSATDLADSERAVVVVLHNLALAARYCDRVVIMHEGRIHAAGAPGDVLDADLLRQVFAVDSGYADLSGLTAALTNMPAIHGRSA